MAHLRDAASILSDYDSSTIRRRFIGKSNGRLPSFPIVCLISNRSRAPRRILRVSMKLAINILMHERGSFGARARGPIRYEAPRTLGSLSLDPEEPDRFGEQPLLRFFGGCHSSVDTLGALRSARCPLLRSSSFNFCSLRTGSANCGGHRRTPEDVLPACLPAVPLYPPPPPPIPLVRDLGVDARSIASALRD